jgi:hypothetical protein
MVQIVKVNEKGTESYQGKIFFEKYFGGVATQYIWIVLA